MIHVSIELTDITPIVDELTVTWDDPSIPERIAAQPDQLEIDVRFSKLAREQLRAAVTAHVLTTLNRRPE